MNYSFFLGANSPKGFFSYYDYLIDLNSANEVYILKSGPGGGKSSFIRRVAAPLIEAGLTPEYIRCSSDPSSLDGVIFEEIGVAFVDGTPPHAIEPRYPYAVERYLHIGAFVDADIVKQQRDAIVAAADAYRECYGGAYRCISAAHAIEQDMRGIVMTDGAVERALRRVAGIVKREFKPLGNGYGVERRRFLDGITPDGIVALTDTVVELACKVFEIQDTYGIGGAMLEALCRAARSAGHDVYTCWDPMSPDRLKHLIIPSLEVAFVTMPVTDPYRRIRLDAYLEPNVLSRNKQKLKFLRRAKNALLEDAVADIHEAKLRHDRLEDLYNPAVDFDALYAYADRLGAELKDRYCG